MRHRGTELRHHGELFEGLDLLLPLVHTLLADPLGQALDWLLGDVQSGEDLEVLAAGGERRVLYPGVGDLP